MIIRATGKVSLCCHDYYTSVEMGDINKQSLMEVWYDGKNVERRERIARGILKDKLCMKCMKEKRKK